MNSLILKRLGFALLGAVAMLAVSPAYAQIPHSDEAILRLPSHSVEVLQLDEGNEGDNDQPALFNTVSNPLFNLSAGVIFFLQAGAVAPSATFTIGTNPLADVLAANGLSFSDLSDVFGVNFNVQNNAQNLGFSSGLSTLALYEAFGVPGQSFTFLVETGGPVDLSGRFLTKAATDLGYTVTFQSDVGDIPEPSTWAMVALGAGLLFGVKRLHRKRC